MKMTTKDYSLVPDEFLFFVDGATPGVVSPRRPHPVPSWGLSKSRGNCVATAAGNGGLRSPVFRRCGDARPVGGVLHPEMSGRGLAPRKDGCDSRPFKYKLKEWAARQSHPVAPKSDVHNNTYALLESSDEDCTRAAGLWKKAYNCVLHLAAELDVEPVKDLPPSVRCGGLRAAVEGCFPDSVPLQAKLSIKTVQKLERSSCRSCESGFEERIEAWREARFQPIEVDQGHLSLFKRMFRANIPRGWNRQAESIPFIPNGHASQHPRREGGNWCEEEFSDKCRYDLVFSAGKPRVVTMYSSYNTRVLSPLHQSLQRHLEKQGWLLIGPPTAEHVRTLNGEGNYLSFDYKSATDNIKQPYVEAAVDVLIECADPKLDDDQIRCLRVLSALQFEGDSRVSTRGQPMGSLMSFPLLSLTNKTIVDLALADLLQGGQLSFKEWTGHRLLVNGDDLLTKEPRSRPGQHSLAEAVFRHGRHVGLESNWEKTLCDPFDAEINSTLFHRGDFVKKVNVASLYMKPDVDDVLGFALESTCSAEGFRKVVRANARYLARQFRKGYRDLPLPLQRLCKRDRKIRKALKSGPADRIKPEATNFFPVSPRPEGYDLTREEEVQLIHAKVTELRGFVPRLIAEEFRKPKERRAPPILKERSWRAVKYEKRPPKAEDVILHVLASGWYCKQKERLAEEGEGILLTQAYCLPPSDAPNRAEMLVDAARAFRKAKDLRCDPITPVPDRDRQQCPFRDGSEWIALE